MLCLNFTLSSSLSKLSYGQCKACVELSSLVRRDVWSLACILAPKNYHTRSEDNGSNGHIYQPNILNQCINQYVRTNNSKSQHFGDRQDLCHHRPSIYSNVSPLDCQSLRRFHTNYSLLNCDNPNLIKKTKATNEVKDSNETTELNPSQEEQKKVKNVKENIYTIPNLLTCLRIAVTPYLSYLVITREFDLGFKIFFLAGLSDFLDGFIARNFKNQQSVLGSALDPVADKLMVSMLTVTLSVVELLPVPLTCVIIGRDALLIAAGFYLRYITLPPPKNLKRYFDVSLPSVTILPSTLSKWNTSLQILLIAASMAAPVFGFVDHTYLQGLWYLTGLTTVASGIQYLVFRNKYIKFTHDKLKRQI